MQTWLARWASRFRANRGAGISHLNRDFLYAIRMAGRSPGFTAVAVLSLALGIGANTAIFSVADALLLKSLPVEKPERLVVFAGWDQAIHQWMYFFTYREFEELLRRTGSFSEMASTWAVDRAGVLSNGRVDEEQTHIGIVSGNYFATLGVTPATGRSFGNDEAAAIVSYGFWERRFGLAPDVLGRTVEMNGRVLTIVGVAPRRFTGDSVGQPIDLWIPAAIADTPATGWAPQPEIDATVFPALSYTVSCGLASTPLTPNWASVGPTARTRSVSAVVPEITNPATSGCAVPAT